MWYPKAIVVLLLIVCSVWGYYPKGFLTAANDDDLSKVVGGGCYYCNTQSVCGEDIAQPCHSVNLPQGGTAYTYTLGTGISQAFCKDSELRGEYQRCNTRSDQDCAMTFTCTSITGLGPVYTCTNCGPPAVEKKSTECTFFPYTPCDG
jgi:hypothetical protein